MEKKLCKKCGIEKGTDNFRIKNVNGKNYLYSYCKESERKINKEYIENHKKRRKEYMNEYRKENKEKLNIQRNILRKKNIEKTRYLNKKSYERNKEKILKHNKEYRIKNKTKINQQVLNRKQNDYIFKLKCQTRNILLNSFKRNGKIKSERTEKILGCNLEFFVEYLLQTFKNNYGYEWDKVEPVHIDHIIPLKYANNEKEVFKYCNYRNLQLLKAEDNLHKGSKLDYTL